MQILNRALPKQIVDELYYLESRYFVFDKPIPFKGNLTLYPVTVEDYVEFIQCSACCTLNKNESEEGIVMRHLDFLMSQTENLDTGKEWLHRFIRLLELVFHKTNGFLCQECETFISAADIQKFLLEGNDLGNFVCPQCGGKNFGEAIKIRRDPNSNQYIISIYGTELNANDFDRFRQIVLYQNFPDYQDDSSIHYELKKDKELYRQTVMGGRTKSPSLEKKIVCLSVGTSYKIQEIYNLPLRKFLMLFSSLDDLIEYKILKSASVSGMVKFKKPIEHWIYKEEQSAYGQYHEASGYINKISSI